MSITIQHTLPTPESLKSELSLDKNLAQVKATRDAEIASVLTGASNKFLVIAGPCSADNADAVCEYVARLARLHERVKDKLVLIPRIYATKPRTTGEGYKGLLHQPTPLGAPNLSQGLYAMRALHLRAIKESGLTAADEMLYPENRDYLDDLLSYEVVGARSVENQLHRFVASGADTAVGMKNPMNGDPMATLHSVHAAQHGHNFIYRACDVTTAGNPLAHVILRGSVDTAGKHCPNYSYEALSSFCQRYLDYGLKNPAVIVDANHSNSGKDFTRQGEIVKDVLHSRTKDATVARLVKGIMIESYLVCGNQLPSSHPTYGQSITDACIGWEETERILLDIAENC